MKPYTLLFYAVLLVLATHVIFLEASRSAACTAFMVYREYIFSGWCSGPSTSTPRTPCMDDASRTRGHVVIVLPLTGMVVLGHPSTGRPAVDTLGPLFTLLLQAALLALLYRYLCRHEVRGYVYYVVFVTVRPFVLGLVLRC